LSRSLKPAVRKPAATALPSPRPPTALHLHARALRYFDMIRRCGSIREAARRLHVSSSAVNRQLLQLEAEIGMPLFERLQAGLRLSAAGEALSRHVITVLQDAQRLSADLDALEGVRRGAVEVVCVEALTADFLPGVIETMAARYPGVRIGVRIAGSAAAAATVVSGEADVALGFVLRRSAELRQVAVGRFALGALVHPSHPLAADSTVAFAECTRHPLVMPGPALSLHWELAPLVAACKRPLQVVVSTESLELMKELARRGVGVAFVNGFGIERELRAGQLRHLPLRGAPPSDLGAYVRAGRVLPPAVDAFAQVVAAAIEARAASA
jgi:DNA-binding transcriptional LysR family regulator